MEGFLVERLMVILMQLLENHRKNSKWIYRNDFKNFFCEHLRRTSYGVLRFFKNKFQKISRKLVTKFKESESREMRQEEPLVEFQIELRKISKKNLQNVYHKKTKQYHTILPENPKNNPLKQSQKMPLIRDYKKQSHEISQKTAKRNSQRNSHKDFYYSKKNQAESYEIYSQKHF